MKKSYLFSALVAGTAMLSSCGSDDSLATTSSDNANDVKQQIVLQVSNSGDGLQTRAGRPLYSSEAKQSIENVKLIICNASNEVTYVKTIEKWNTDDVSKTYTTGGHGREKTITLSDDDKLAEGKYTVYAIGYSSSSDYSNIADKVTDIAKNSSYTGNPELTLKDGVVGEEIFAGSLSLTVKDGVGFKTPVVLNRQVAGTFGYFKSIPYDKDAAKLQLVAYQRNTHLVLGQFGNYDLTGNGTGNGEHVNYVINGGTAANSKVIYTITLSEWFKEVKDANNDGLIDGDADNWNKPDTYKDVANFQTGSVFGGTFVIPFAKSASSDKTFVLQLTKEDGTVLKSWTVKLPSTDGQLSAHTLYTWGTNSFTETSSSTDTQTTYNVVRNHLYGIGERALDNPENPSTPDPSNPDTPEDLSKKQELTLRVNDNWEVIHKMEVEEE